MFSQIRSIFEKYQQTTLSPSFISVAAPHTQFVATKTSDAVQGTTADAPKTGSSKSMSHVRKLEKMEKRFLVWTGKFKTLADVPDSVSYEIIEKARNKIRIRMANLMIALTIIGCIGFALSGKEAAKKGDSVKKMNLEWHKNIKEEKTEK